MSRRWVLKRRPTRTCGTTPASTGTRSSPRLQRDRRRRLQTLVGFAANVEILRQVGTRRYYHLDALATPIDPAGTPASDAVEALARAARATILVQGSYDSPWASSTS
jgi:hypothetical protein